MRPAEIAIRMMLAGLILAGMSSSALGVLFCSSGLCGSSCGMHEQAASKPKESHSCCPEKAEDTSKQKDSKCTCKLQSAPDAKLAPPATVLLPLLSLAALPVEETALAVATPPDSRRRILFHSDSSPPDRARQPDLGRAPPAA